MLIATTRSIYHNVRFLNKNGDLIFFAQQKRARWYLDRGLAQVVSEEPYTVQLNFQTNGDGKKNDPFYLQERRNICVVCGISENLTCHHCVPYCYRIYFPEDLKSHSCHDILPLCVQHHEAYEKHADQFRRELSKEFDVPYGGICEYDRGLVEAIKAARSLHGHEAKIPKDRKDILWARIKNRFPNEEIGLGELAKMHWQTISIPHGKLMMEKVSDVSAFMRRWREHFVQHTQPKFLPPYWSVEREKP
jgi:hypothetical protein